MKKSTKIIFIILLIMIVALVLAYRFIWIGIGFWGVPRDVGLAFEGIVKSPIYYS